MEDKIKLKLGDVLYKYATTKLLNYTVFGLVHREEGIYYQIRCNDCLTHDKCEVLIKENDRGNLVYVSMLNENYQDKQFYWHVTDDLHSYALTKKSALSSRIKSNIQWNNEKIQELRERIEALQTATMKSTEYLKALDEN